MNDRSGRDFDRTGPVSFPEVMNSGLRPENHVTDSGPRPGSAAAADAAAGCQGPARELICHLPQE